MKKLFAFVFAAGMLLGCDPKDQIDVKGDSTKYDVNLVDETVKGVVEVRNGVLHFKDLKSYDNVLSQVLKKESLTLDGFESYYSIQQRLISEMDSEEFKRKSKQEFNAWVEKNSDYLKYEDEMIRFKNNNPREGKLINKEYTMYIGRILYRFTDDLQTIVLDGDISKLYNKTSEEVKQIDRQTKPKQKNSKVTGLCYGVVNKESVNDRQKSTISAGISPSYILIGNSLYEYRFSAWVSTISERRYLGVYYNDQTAQTLLTSYSVQGSCLYPINNGNNILSFSEGTFVSFSQSIANHPSYFSGEIIGVPFGTCSAYFNFTGLGYRKIAKDNVHNTMDCP